MKFLFVLLLPIFVSCTNPEVPAGHEGYIIESPRIFGKGGFEQVLVGPKNRGFSLFNYVSTNIDTRPNTYKELFNILTMDKLNMSLAAEVILSLKSGSVKQVVENYGAEKWYEKYVMEVFRGLVRSNVTKFKSGELKEKRKEIQEAILLELNQYLANTPIVVNRLIIGNIDFPTKVVTEIENRVAMEEQEKAMDIKNSIAQKEAIIRITEAEGIAKAQKIIDKSLTVNYLQYEAIKAQKAMAGSPNHTTVYIPVGENGIPLMKSVK